MSNLNILEKIVDYIKCSDAIATRMQKQAAEQSAVESKVAELVPAAVEALIKNDRLPDNLREKAASLLKDHGHALEILINTANHRNHSEQSTMGSPTGNGHQKRAARGSINSPYCGVRSTEERESDRVLIERLGIR